MALIGHEFFPNPLQRNDSSFLPSLLFVLCTFLRSTNQRQPLSGSNGLLFLFWGVVGRFRRASLVPPSPTKELVTLTQCQACLSKSSAARFTCNLLPNQEETVHTRLQVVLLPLRIIDLLLLPPPERRPPPSPPPLPPRCLLPPFRPRRRPLPPRPPRLGLSRCATYR